MSNYFVTAHDAARSLNNGYCSYFTPQFVAENSGRINTMHPNFQELIDKYAARLEKGVQRKAERFGYRLRGCDPRVEAFAEGMSDDDLLTVVRHYVCYNKLGYHKWRVCDRDDYVMFSVMDMIEFYQNYSIYHYPY